jgi:hypothetical protein
MNLPSNLGDFARRATAPDHPLFIGLDLDGGVKVVTRQHRYLSEG